jgi:hypothetical protein
MGKIVSVYERPPRNGLIHFTLILMGKIVSVHERPPGTD